MTLSVQLLKVVGCPIQFQKAAYEREIALRPAATRVSLCYVPLGHTAYCLILVEVAFDSKGE